MTALTIRAALLCAAQLALTARLHAAEPEFPRDGWASWEVAAVEDAPAWCCWSSWDDSAAETKPCKLDGDRQGYGTRGKATPDSIRVYARFKSGKVERLRALAAACPVESATPIRNLENVSTDDSVRWLVGLAKTDQATLAARDDHDDNQLAALAMHRGALALQALDTIARNDARVDMRKQAIFWLAEMRGTAGADIVTTTMFSDQDADVRKHAAFAITQSRSPRVSADLIRLGNTDKNRDVRAQAWFWLAQTGAANAEDAILAAIKIDDDEHVREQGVFALSQLPDERATHALVTVAEDRSMGREQRKRALFWLGQSESTGAQTYLEKVLLGNATR